MIRDGKYMVGYILSETKNEWVVKPMNNKTIRVGKLRCGSDGYIYPGQQLKNRRYYKISQYWPIRLLVHSSGECRLTLNRIAFDEHSKIVPQLSSYSSIMICLIFIINNY